MFDFETSGSFDNIEKFLKTMQDSHIFETLEKYGKRGVDALRAATPVESGVTADSWYYEIKKERNTWSIIWGNTNVVNGTPLAILLQYGHGTRNGGYVEGRNYINPALQSIFDAMSEEAWKAVRSA